MSSHSRVGAQFRWVSRSAIVALFAGILPALSAVAAGDPQEARMRAHLDAGEFAPALEIARQAGNDQQRDARLTQVAAAQARAGARDAALRTAGEIYDARARSAVLAQLAAEPLGGRGGGAEADFEALIELITSTIQPTTWDEVGGPGSVKEFPTGVYIDPQGVMRRLLKQTDGDALAALRAASASVTASKNVRQSSKLRKVSLPRLEKYVQMRLAAGQQPTEAMQVLAGLQRIRYVFVYPDSGELVLAGPAGDWQTGPEDRILSTETGQPVLRLDDLVVVLRQMLGAPDARFGCAITPTKDSLARAKAFLSRPQPRFDNSGQRKAWLEQLRTQLGQQEIEVYGLDPRTRAAAVMVEADYRMKLVGMGLEEGTPGVESYLGLIRVGEGQSPPPLGVLRWWFTLDYDALLATDDRQGFALRGQGVKVLSENELLTARGERVHTGKAETLNRQFARSFTKHFGRLCEKYPVYAELRNVCDLALVGALIREEDLAGKVGWQLTCFGGEDLDRPLVYRVALGPVPEKVDTVANYRVIRNRRQIHTIAGVSGGVRVDPAPLVHTSAIETDGNETLNREHSTATPRELPAEAWWWD